MAALSSIDLSKAGKYPIVLSDALLGMSSKEVYTSIRYNHKPDPATGSSKEPIHVKPSKADPTNYNLSFSDNGDEYAYSGTRSTASNGSGTGQYVLIFDPPNKRFVLHRVDSTFDMNLIKAPWEGDAAVLQSQYAQLETSAAAPVSAKAKAPSTIVHGRVKKSAKATPAATSTSAASVKTETKRRKGAAPAPAAEKPKKNPPPPAPSKRKVTPESDEESDDGLTIEYPDGAPPSSSLLSAQYQPHITTPLIRRNDDSDEVMSEEDADGEYPMEVVKLNGKQNNSSNHNLDVDEDHLALPSPANNNAGGISGEDLELDLEADLDMALNETAGAGIGESDESEEE